MTKTKTDFHKVKSSYDEKFNVNNISEPAVVKNTTIAGCFGWSCRKSEKIRRNIRYSIKFIEKRGEDAETK
jgi:hypothetical protein